MRKKLAQIYVQFLAILLNCTDWAITGRIARVQFNSTLERKVKTGALKGIFLVCKWINNTIKSNSVPYHVHHRKSLSFLSSFGLRAVFVKNSRICQHCDVKTTMVTPSFYYFFIIFLTCYISIASFIYNLCYVLLLGNHFKLSFAVFKDAVKIERLRIHCLRLRVHA